MLTSQISKREDIIKLLPLAIAKLLLYYFIYFFLIEMLGWFCVLLTMVERTLLKGHVVAGLHDDMLPDKVVNSDISILRPFFADEAWPRERYG